MVSQKVIYSPKKVSSSVKEGRGSGVSQKVAKHEGGVSQKVTKSEGGVGVGQKVAKSDGGREDLF